MFTIVVSVLNLIINGIPSIHNSAQGVAYIKVYVVLNLIINGIPSILKKEEICLLLLLRF